MRNYDAIVIGAGPAGMMVAIRAAEGAKKILLIERNSNLGVKLITTGGGRCNLTNTCDSKDFLNNFSSSRDFLRNSFAQFFNTDLLSFFEKSGIVFKTEENGCVFPVSDKAGDILNILKQKLQKNNVEIIYNERVKDIIAKDGKIKGIVTFSNKHFLASRIVIATGGISYPQTGSTGDGYKLAKKLGHTIVALKPALVPIAIKEKFVQDWQGISLKKVRVTVLSNSKKIAERLGDVIFTHFGVSGPIILDVSAATYDALESHNVGRRPDPSLFPTERRESLATGLELKNSVELIINFTPKLTQKELDALVLRELKINSAKTIKNMFKDVLPRKMMERFLEYCNLSPDISAHQMTIGERKMLIKGLSGLRLTVEAVLPIKDGIVTRGGVSTKEINPKTMESKLIKGLFFAGEIIDVDATTGGYNLQAAFSTGWVCGNNLNMV
ncbi:MAG: NAD(P)/FAD-dependent oxidoreductase [Candidatus Omnitrophota bacterium]|nr:NAD(P)/FAD-dependent oxidoreductase [Candidatus Omnitrophota bacterium]